MKILNYRQKNTQIHAEIQSEHQTTTTYNDTIIQDLEKQPHIVDPVTVLTATNLSFITPS